MNKMLVAVFDSEPRAYEGLNALRDLHYSGDITLYANAVVSKDNTGQIRVEQTAEEGPIGTATGLLTGSLVGLLAGPIGLAVGAGIGTVTGMAFDIDKDYVNVAFVDEVSGALAKGKTAILAEVDESWTVPVNTRLEPLGGIVFRRLRYEVEEDLLKREADDIRAEFNAMQEELKAADEADKARFNQATANLKAKARMTNEQIGRKMNEFQSQMDAKVEKIEAQMQEAGERRRSRLQKRINAIKEEYKARMDKLKQASRLISEAFGLKEADIRTMASNA